MRRWMAGVLSGVMLCGLLTTGAAAEAAFWDVPEDAYYAQAVSWAVERGMAAGTGEGMFSPDAQCTTAQVVSMLWAAMGAQEPVRGNHFSDVPANAYYAKAATWAYEKGLVSGTTFRGDAPCLRGDIAAMLWKMAGRPSAQSGTQWNCSWSIGNRSSLRDSQWLWPPFRAGSTRWMHGVWLSWSRCWTTAGRRDFRRRCALLTARKRNSGGWSTGRPAGGRRWDTLASRSRGRRLR